jgi:S1-C subfamily serine protease
VTLRPTTALAALAALAAGVATALLAGPLTAEAAPEDETIRVPRASSTMFGKSDRKKARRIMDAGYLADTVVRIDVAKAGGEVHTGSGVVICQVDQRIFVLTATHVLNGADLTDRGVPDDPLVGVKRITVSFQGDSPRPVQRKPGRLDAWWAEDADIALLAFQIKEDRQVAVARWARSPKLENGSPVRTIGYSRQAERSWLPHDGEVRDLGEFLLFAPPTDQGYSGGPVFNGRGRIVGINRNVEAGEFTAATRIEQAVAFALRHLPGSCIR